MKDEHRLEAGATPHSTPHTPQPFELQGDGGPVRPKALARALGVSTQAVAKWRGEGMPYAGRDALGFVYDVEECRRWKQRNRGGKTHGGRREGAGRKRRRPAADPAIVARVEAGLTRERIRERAERGELPEFGGGGIGKGLLVEDLLYLTHAELRALVALAPEESGLDKASLERLKLIQETRAKHRDEQEKLGQLVTADSVREEFARRLAQVRNRLEQLPHRLLREVMSVTGAGVETEPAVLAALGAAVDAVMGEIRGAESSKAEKLKSSK